MTCRWEPNSSQVNCQKRPRLAVRTSSMRLAPAVTIEPRSTRRFVVLLDFTKRFPSPRENPRLERPQERWDAKYRTPRPSGVKQPFDAPGDDLAIHIFPRSNGPGRQP